MSALALLAELKRRGIRLWLDGPRLRYRGPKGALTAELVDALRASTADVVTLLAPTEGGVTEWPSPVCGSCATTTAMVFMEMSPGPDRSRWWLCSRCWR